MTEIVLAVISGVVSIATCMIANGTAKKVEQNSIDMQLNNIHQNDALKCMMRSEILNIYYQYKDTKKMPEYVRINLDLLCKGYIDGLNGNSFVKDIYAEMRKWEVIR